MSLSGIAQSLLILLDLFNYLEISKNDSVRLLNIKIRAHSKAITGLLFIKFSNGLIWLETDDFNFHKHFSKSKQTKEENKKTRAILVDTHHVTQEQKVASFCPLRGQNLVRNRLEELIVP